MSTSQRPHVPIKYLCDDPTIDVSAFFVVHGIDAEDPLFNNSDVR